MSSSSAKQQAQAHLYALQANDEAARQGKPYHVEGELRYWNECTYTTYALPPHYSTYITVHVLEPDTLMFSDDEHAPYRAPLPACCLPQGVTREQLRFRGKELLDAAVQVDMLASRLGPFEKRFSADVDGVPFPFSAANRRCYSCDQPLLSGDENSRVICYMRLPNTPQGEAFPVYGCASEKECSGHPLCFDDNGKRCKGGDANEPAVVLNYGMSFLHPNKLVKNAQCLCCRRVAEREYSGQKQPDNWTPLFLNVRILKRALPLRQDHKALVEAMLGENPVRCVSSSATSKWICDECICVVATIERTITHPLRATAIAFLRIANDGDDGTSAADKLRDSAVPPVWPAVGAKRAAAATDEMAVPTGKIVAMATD